uniref:Uncharacterized protein n=1 Tax=Hemiselmis andersenii TaxID=464988 RepID=A0A6U4P6S5_HEMAN|mmetsp:Transcript_11096/g.25962  ORF Transcript_11096/g.25962 Transcript_11096/m.25962 type:complete len:100 (-) Transcript_11096:218-517(-)
MQKLSRLISGSQLGMRRHPGAQLVVGHSYEDDDELLECEELELELWLELALELECDDEDEDEDEYDDDEEDEEQGGHLSTPMAAMAMPTSLCVPGTWSG